MRVVVKFLSPLSLKSDSEELLVEVDDGSVRSVLKELVHKYGNRLEPLIFEKDGNPYTRFSVNGNVVEMDFVLRDGETLWILPPIAGG